MNLGPTGSIDAQWQAQERALRDGIERADVVLARALQTAPVSSPPPCFAADVVYAMHARLVAETADGRAERMLLLALGAALAIAAAISAVAYGSAWWAAATASLGREALVWATFATICLACVSVPWRRASGGAPSPG